MKALNYGGFLNAGRLNLKVFHPGAEGVGLASDFG